MRTPPKWLMGAFCVAVVLGGTGTARAQYYAPPPPAPMYGAPFLPFFYVGGGLSATHILSQQGGPEVLGDGVGASVWAGVRLAPRFALEVSLFDSDHNPEPTTDFFGNYTGTSYVVLSGLTADAQLHFAPPRGFDPYVQGGLGLYSLGRDVVGTNVAGGGFQLGGGFDLWLGPFWTVGLRGLYRGINMSQSQSGQPDTFIHAFSFEGNMSLHFR